MQTNKNKISEQALGIADTINNASRVATLYGKLFAIKDMQIHLLKQEKLIKDQLESEERKWVE